MNYFDKQRILIWGLVLMLILNVSALTTIWLKRNTVPAIQSPQVPIVAPENEEMRGVNFFIRSELNFTPDQWYQYKKIRQHNMEHSNEIFSQLSVERMNLLSELSKDNPSEKKLKEIANEMGSLHKQLKLETIDFFLKVNDMCTPEQKKKFKHLFVEIQSHVPMQRHGGQGKMRRRRMMQNQ